MNSASTTLIYPLTSIVDRLDLKQLFAKDQPLEVELGAGDGSFLIKYAGASPDRNFLGVERLLGRIRKIDRKGQRAGLTNLRLVRLEASYFLEYLVPKQSAAAIHVYFPDPWPKRKHNRRRLINEHFTQIAQAALLPRGIVYLRTDDLNYFTQMKEVFGANRSFVEIQTPEPLCAVQTDFERGFLARGIQTLRAAYQRTD